MRSKLKNLLAHFKPMSYLYHHKGRANLLLWRQLMREWKLKTHHMRIRLKRMWRILLRTSESSWSSKRIKSLLRKENSQIPGRRKRISRRKIGRILNLLKESCAVNAMVMDISRRSVPTIWEGRVKCMPLLSMTQTPLIQTQKKAVTKREITLHSRPLLPYTKVKVDGDSRLIRWWGRWRNNGITRIL